MVSRNVIEVNEEKPMSQLFFLKEDEDRSVEVEEVYFRGVERRLEQGESVLIKCKSKQKLNTSLVAMVDAAVPWYFSRI